MPHLRSGLRTIDPTCPCPLCGKVAHHTDDGFIDYLNYDYQHITGPVPDDAYFCFDCGLGPGHAFGFTWFAALDVLRQPRHHPLTELCWRFWADAGDELFWLGTPVLRHLRIEYEIRAYGFTTYRY